MPGSGGEVLGMVISDGIFGPIGIRSNGIYVDPSFFDASAPGLYQVLGLGRGAGRAEFRAILLFQGHGETALETRVDILHFAASVS